MKKNLPPSNRKFGLFFSLIFILLTIYSIYKYSVLITGFFAGIGGLLIIISLISPAILSPLNRGWMRLGYMMGKIMNPLILGSIFYFLITPMAISMRLFGRDELRIKRIPCNSYWVERGPTDPNCDSFLNQF
jgi:hypothetical protein